jgi:hypothetical protein
MTAASASDAFKFSQRPRNRGRLPNERGSRAGSARWVRPLTQEQLAQRVRLLEVGSDGRCHLWTRQEAEAWALIAAVSRAERKRRWDEREAARNGRG